MSESRITQPPSQRLEAYRHALGLLGRLQLTGRLAGKVDVSGVVQKTLWEADQSVLPESDADLLIWLRHIFANNLRDEIRRHTAARRDVRREVSLETAMEESSHRISTWLAEKTASPSAQMLRVEYLQRLAIALHELTEAQRSVIELHHLQGLTIGETADRLGRTKDATSALLYRALRSLKTLFQSEDA